MKKVKIFNFDNREISTLTTKTVVLQEKKELLTSSNNG